MRLTRRGWAVVAVGVVAELMALAFGARALNAIVAPAIVALAVGFVVLARRETPTLTRGRIQPGYPGERRTVRLDVTADGPTTIRDELPEGLAAVDASTAPATDADDADDADATYEVRLRSRGEHRIGPAHVVQRDPLGVLARETTVAELTPVLVYPEVVSIDPTRAFAALVETTGSPERQAFDRLREYVPGDALRDVDWKSSAKRADDDLVVTEYADEASTGITLVAAGEPGHGDEMAGAAASIAAYLEANDLPVTLVTPAGELREGRGDEHYDDLLDLLARVSAGRTGDRPDADVRVFAGPDGVEITVRGSTVAFDALRADDPGAAVDALDRAGDRDGDGDGDGEGDARRSREATEVFA